LVSFACAALLVLAHVGSARGADPTPTPSAKELWNTYPLTPTSTPAATRTPAPERNVSARAATTGGGDGLWVAAVAALVAVTIGGLALVATRRRRGGSSTTRSEPSTKGPSRPAQRAPERDQRLLSITSQPWLPPDETRAWEAEIEWSEANGGGRFAATAREPGSATAIVIAESSTVTWPPADRVSMRALPDAVAELERSLLTAGWTPRTAGAHWYAKRFAWTPRTVAPSAPDDAPRQSQRLAAVVELPAEPTGRFRRDGDWPDGSEALWRCELHWDSGIVSSRFEAVAYEPGTRRRRVVGSSTSFKWRMLGDPSGSLARYSSEQARLTAALEAAGWERVGRGECWYSERFIWRGAGEPAPAARGGRAQPARTA
jgi:hypothetical protein